MSWILNSILKDLIGSFLYATTTRELWVKLGERNGKSNGPMIYQIKQRITLISQENPLVMVYYNKLKQLLDKLTNIVPIPPYSCGSEKLATKIHNANHLMKFLMGLNDAFN